MKRWQIIALFGLLLAGFALTPVGRKLVTETLQKLSALGLNLLKRHEGLRLEVYQDVAKKWTIGYGHLVKPGEKYHPYGPVTRITQEEAEQLLLRDTATAENAVRSLVRVPLNEGQFNSLVSFVYNVGSNAFATSTLLRKLNAGDYRGSGEEFDKWVYAGGEIWKGLVARRAQEKQTFFT